MRFCVSLIQTIENGVGAGPFCCGVAGADPDVGSSVGSGVGVSVGPGVITATCSKVGVGSAVGTAVGAAVGVSVGTGVGAVATEKSASQPKSRMLISKISAAKGINLQISRFMYCIITGIDKNVYRNPDHPGRIAP